VSSTVPALEAFHEGWANHQRLLLSALRGLTPEQLDLRTAPHMWAVWQLASHLAGSRAYWLHDVLGEGDPAVRDMFRVERTTVPDLSLEDAGWEDDEDHPRSATEIAHGLTRSWELVDECLGRWTADDLLVEFTRERRTGTQTLTRAWVIWHVLEHDVHHAGEISQILGSRRVPALDL